MPAVVSSAQLLQEHYRQSSFAERKGGEAGGKGRQQCLPLHHLCPHQAAISWRASSDRQISLSASVERTFANFCDKNTVFYNCKFLQHKRRFFLQFCQQNL